MPGKARADKSLESWIWDAACSIRGAQEAPKYKDFILPLIFAKRLCDVFDDEVNRIAGGVGSRKRAFGMVARDHQLVRFYLPLKPDDPEAEVWSVIRGLADKIGERLTSHLRGIAKANPLLEGIIDRMDFNATTHGQRDISDDRLSGLIEKISEKRLGLDDVEPDIIGRSYEYLIGKFAEGAGKSAGEFYTPREVGMVMAKIMNPKPGMTIKAEVVKNDYNISPSRYIHTADAETYRPVAEIVAELKVAEAEARRSNAALKKVLARLGIET